jgi:ABC-type amino acid transport system permease subunit
MISWPSMEYHYGHSRRTRLWKDPPIRTLLSRGWPVAIASVLVLLASLPPWFRTRFAVNDRWAVETASAWEASTWWGVAVTLSLAAAALGLAGAAARRGAGSRILRWGAVAVAVAAALLTVAIWRSIPSLTDHHSSFGWRASGDSSPGVGDIVRDRLVLVDRNGLNQQVAWGLYAGLTAMGLLIAVLIVNAVRSPRPR